IDEETDRLDSLVSETIRMARIEAGGFHLERRSQRVGDLITAGFEKLRNLLEDREGQDGTEQKPPQVNAGAGLIGLTIRQLLTNALKYANPESPIIIKARRADGAVTISVKDFGPGISPKDQNRIFEKYYRVKDNTDRIPGTGMGLAIARNIVEAH